jgi:ABC-type multidrug transport system fused ATPase/permease subunit
VLVDGEDVRTLDLAWLRRNVGTVSQDPTLFDGTVAENVAYAVGGPHRTTNDSIATAAEIANARGFIEAFPDGYDTRVGENGALLSGGQKQRLAIARVVLADPAILLLDEATSALDAESEAAVSEALTKVAAGRTVILVAHRLSTVRRADRVGVLKDGRLVECGTHEQLMAKKDGAYRALVQTQLQA